MTAETRDLCPCGCGGEVPPVTGFGTTPFISVDGIKVYLATTQCSKRCTCSTCGPKSSGCAVVLTACSLDQQYFCDVVCLQVWQNKNLAGT